MNESQRAMVAARLAILPRGSNHLASIEAPSQVEAAEMLNESQRAMVAARLATLSHVGGDRRSDHSANLHNDPTQSEAADILNVSTRSVASASAVLDNGVPELVQAVERGSVSVSLAEKIALRADVGAEVSLVKGALLTAGAP